MSAPVTFSRTTTSLTTRGISAVFHVRTMVTSLVVLAIGVLLGMVALGVGDYELSIGEVAATFVGQGPAGAELVVLEWRLPRVLAALVIGAALGMSGAIFQSLTKNPLGSPDIIGFNTGAYTGALLVMIVFNASYYAVAFGAIVGGLATALLVYVFAWRRGMHGFRLIIVGIAISAMLASVNTWIIVSAELEAAMAAAVWGAGSLNGISWGYTLPSAIAIAVFMILALVLSGKLRMLEMGDDAAAALGVNVERSRVFLVIVGVGLTAVCTAAVGPIAFVALCAPQLMKRVARTTSVALLPSAAMGATLLMACDLLAQRAFAPIQVPVGVITVSLGGIYLIWLLVKEARKS